MLLKRFQLTATVFLVVCCVIQFKAAASYKTEIDITPAPPEDETTKKSGFFGGIKSWFGSSPDTTTVAPVLAVTTKKTQQTFAGANSDFSGGQSAGAQRPPPLQINPAPLAPLGPRPDTPSSSPWGGNAQQPPQWPQAQGGQQTGSGSNVAQQQPPFPKPQQVGGGSPTPGGSPVAGGTHVPGATSSNLNPPQPQSPHNVQHNLPRPGVAPTNFPSSQPQSPQSNLPRPSNGQSNFPTYSTNHNQNNLPHPSVGVQPNMPPGFGSYQPPKSQPSGIDLSYGGGFGGGSAPGPRPAQPSGRPGFGPSSGTSFVSGGATSTSTTTVKPGQMDIDLRLGGDPNKPATPTKGKDDFPALPTPRRPSIGGAKEEYPTLPTPKSPVPSSPVSPSSPSAWNKPLPTPAYVAPSSTTTVKTPHAPAAPGGAGVSFVPHTGPTTTVRPGFQSNGDGNSVATDAEIQTLTETLYTKEVNSQLNLISVSPQGKTRSIDSTDEAPKPLLDVNNQAFENPTVAKMRLLFNNYESDTLANEHVTPNERKEENEFLDAVMATNVMRQAMLFLQNKGIVGPDPKTHRDLVKELWFTQYSRGQGKIGSSGFEHVFVNEVKNGTIIGLHNWVYFADEEKAGRLDYKGYLNQLDLGTKAKVLKVRFTHNGLNKPVNSLFIGTSPELELAVYTVCFKLRPDRSCPVSMGNSKFGVVTYSWRYRGKNTIGSAYPEI